MKLILHTAMIIILAVPAFADDNNLLINIDNLIKHYDFLKNPQKFDKNNNSSRDFISLDPKKQSILIGRQIQKDPRTSFEKLKKIITSKTLSDTALSIYIWAMGHTKDERAVDIISGLYLERRSLNLQNVLNSLIMVGGDAGADRVFKLLDSEKDENSRYSILYKLAEVKYAKALPITMEFLSKDFNSYYWRMIFLYGLYGNKSVSFLMSKIDSKNKVIAFNSFYILGYILMEPELEAVIRDRYWKISDHEIKGLLLDIFFTMSPDIKSTKKFLLEVAKKEPDKKLLEKTRTLIGEIDKIKKNAVYYNEKKSKNAAGYKSEYEKIYRSYGKEGDYNELMSFSSRENEGELIALRERILLRHSDECLNEMKIVNKIILYNRVIEILFPKK